MACPWSNIPAFATAYNANDPFADNQMITRSEFCVFSLSNIQTLIAQPNASYLVVYLLNDATANRKSVAVAVDGNGLQLQGGVMFCSDYNCPPDCDSSPMLNAIKNVATQNR